jgi:NAD(P)-dependent dehydrogenase (short-subunit alcohol dehydrogenase family)
MTGAISLEGRVAVVTGGTRNIGLAIARAFAGAGADVLITGRSAASAGQVAAGLAAETGRQVIGKDCDVTAVDEMEGLGADVLELFGGVDVVVNNALVVAKSPAQEAELARSVLTAPRGLWDEGIDGYVHGPLALLRPLVPSMRERGKGSILNLVSSASFRIVEGLGIYGVTKGAMWSWTQYLAAELAPTIRVNAISPGTVSATGELEDEPHRALLQKVPLGRMGLADEVASGALFLASDASSYITGQVLHLDGGRVALS